MQNFTLGKKGYSLLLFALVLLIGSSPSFGQCPTVSNTSPDDFCYLSTVADLTGETGTTISSGTIAWYRTLTSVNPIPNDELLQDGDYYAGNQSGTCTSRTQVSVIVDDFGAPDPLFGNVFSPCVYGAEPAAGASDPDYLKTVQDLIDNISGNDVQIFDQEFDETALAESTVLVRGENYFAGQINPTSGCTTSRVAIRYDPIYTPAPEAEPLQIVCEGATIADLVATATTSLSQGFRWYSTNDSQPALDSSTPLIDGEDYYVSQIVNRSGRNEPPCESTDRVKVTVTVITFDAGPDSPDNEICKADLDARLNGGESGEAIFVSLLGDRDQLQGTTVTFDPTIAEIGAQYQDNPFQTFTTIATFTNEDGCEDDVVIALEVFESYDAGEDGTVTLSSSDSPVNLFDYLGGTPDAGGTWSPGNTDGSFDPSTDPAGVYTYSVGTGGCQDTATVTVTIEECNIAGADHSIEVCNADVAKIFPGVSSVRTYYLNLLDDGVPTDGTFSPTIDDLVSRYNSGDQIGDFITTYTVQSGDCIDSTVLTITIVESSDAGQDGTVTLSSSDSPVNLFDYLGGTPDAGGTWSPGNTDGSFDPSTDPAGVYTYSVGTGGCQDTATVTVTIEECNIAGADHSIEVCNADVAKIFPGISSVRTYYLNLLDDGVPTDGTFSPTIDDLVSRYNSGDQIGDFITTYTVQSGDCIDSTVLTITILPVVPANAGTIEDVTVDCNNEELIVLASLPNEGGNTGGTFTGEGVSNGTFDPSVGPGTYTITYTVDDTADCVAPGTSDETTFTITVQSTFDLGATIVMEMCITEVQAMIANPQLAIDLFNDAVAERTNGDLLGEFTPSIQTIAGQIAAFLANPTASQTFETTYSVSTECGDDSVLISLTINNVTEATTGDIADFQVCVADSTINLFDRLTDANTQGGTFSTEDGEIVNGLFNVSQIGEYNITYTVSEDQAGACVEGTASTQFTVTVIENSFNAGADNSIEVCNSDVRNLSTAAVRNLYLSLLDEGISTDGTFEPSIVQLINQYNFISNYGDFTTTYTLGEGDCADSAVLTVTVIEANEAGEDMELSFCSTEDNVNLFDYLSPYATKNGTFEGYVDGIFDPSNATLGVTTITYEVEDDESVCSTDNFTATFTINVVAPAPANAGDIADQTVCSSDDLVMLAGYLNGSGATPGGTFSGNGVNAEGTMFDPSVGPNTDGYTITYTVNEDDVDACVSGEAISTFTITVTDLPDAPVADANQTFCLIDSPTVGDIVVTGDNVVIYTDADLSEDDIVDVATGLISGNSYYAVSTNDAGTCSSDAVMITVTVSETPAPTLSTDGDEFCRSDNPTIQDLINNFTGSGVLIYTSSTGGSPVAASTALENGVTYYGASVDGTTGCESSERRAVIAKVEFCGIPEGFSPNGDGINDRFVIPDIATNYPSYSIEIFNRWGNVVFKGNASTPDWDGISNQSGTLGNDVLPVGVYFYILNYNDGQTPPVQGKLYLSI